MGFVIFILTMLCVYIRPFNLSLWVYSVLGAAFCLVFGVVDITHIMFVWGMVWDSTLTLVGLIIFCITLEKLLFFDFLAYKILVFLGEKGEDGLISSFKFYVFIVLFGGFLGAFFANDGAILILTPLIIALFGKLDSRTLESSEDSKDNTRNTKSNFFTPLVIFLLVVSFMSDFASNVFVISNLTNIIALHFFHLNALEFSIIMALPQLFIIFASLCFFVIVRKRLPKVLKVRILGATNLEFRHVDSDMRKTSSMSQKSIIIVCFILLVLLLCGIFIANIFALPLSLFTLLCALLSLIFGYKRIDVLSYLKTSPFGIVVFSLGLFVVVFGLHHSSSFVRDIFDYFLGKPFANNSSTNTLIHSQIMQIFSVGILSSIGSSLINNLPMVMLGNLALMDFINPTSLDSNMLDSAALKSQQLLIYAHLLGCNVGAKLTPIGSLATLLWLFSLKRYGIYIGFWRYMMVALLVVPLMLCIGLCGVIAYAVLSSL